jgi:hypothetical protein
VEVNEEYTEHWEEGEVYRLLSCQECGKVVLQMDYVDTRYEGLDGYGEAFITAIHNSR